jgi:hypothetical protein
MTSIGVCVMTDLGVDLVLMMEIVGFFFFFFQVTTSKVLQSWDLHRATTRTGLNVAEGAF